MNRGCSEDMELSLSQGDDGRCLRSLSRGERQVAPFSHSNTDVDHEVPKQASDE